MNRQQRRKALSMHKADTRKGRPSRIEKRLDEIDEHRKEIVRYNKWYNRLGRFIKGLLT